MGVDRDSPCVNVNGTTAVVKRGFTIVELLIVIVVIAILATVTIVAYNGIQNRAKMSSAQNAVAQAGKRTMAYAVENADTYPANLTDFLTAANLSNSGDTTYQYSASNTVPRSFCITATNGNYSYYFSNTVTQPTSGGCAGHSANGVAAITNLITNPSVESSSSGWGTNFGTSGTGTSTRFANGGWSDNGYFSMTWTATPTVTWGGVAGPSSLPVTAGQVYAFSAWVRLSRAQPAYVYLRPNTYPTNGDLGGSSVSATANTWTRVTGTGTIPSGVTSVQIRIERSGGGSWVSGDVLDVSSLMLTQGSTVHQYADGNTSGWVWNGTTNTSTSTGLPL